jgi:hypothetical protein
MDRRATIERVGGWAMVRGVLLTAALVAAPIASSLAPVLGRWWPAAGRPLAVAGLAGFVWLLVAAWVLHGVYALLRRQALYGLPEPPSARGARRGPSPAARPASPTGVAVPRSAAPAGAGGC